MPPEATTLSCDVCPALMVIGFADAVAVRGRTGFTVTVTGLLDAVPLVTVTVYVVVTVGETTGFCRVEVNPAGFETQE